MGRRKPRVELFYMGPAARDAIYALCAPAARAICIVYSRRGETIDGEQTYLEVAMRLKSCVLTALTRRFSIYRYGVNGLTVLCARDFHCSAVAEPGKVRCVNLICTCMTDFDYIYAAWNDASSYICRVNTVFTLRFIMEF